MENLTHIRNPKIKVVSFDDIDKDSDLYIKYKQGCLTEEYLLNSFESQFVIAFYFSKISSVHKYLHSLIEKPITNQSYNVLKQYLKGYEVEEINKLFSCQESPILKALHGEVYRINRISFPDMDRESLSIFDEFFFLGYVTAGSIMMNNFASIFDYYIKYNPKILSILDLSNALVLSSITKNFDICFSYLLKSRLILNILANLDLKKLTNAQLFAVYSLKNVSDDHINLLSSYKISNGFIDLLLALCIDFNFYSKIKKNIFQNIDKLKCKRGLDLFMLSFYHEPLSFDMNIFEKFCKLNKLCNSEEYRYLARDLHVQINDDIIQEIKEIYKKENEIVFDCSNKISSTTNHQILDNPYDNTFENNKHKDSHVKSFEQDLSDLFDISCRQTIKLTTLFAKFTCYIFRKSIDTTTILDFPEKFFSYALKYDTAEDAKNLKLFNDNLLNDRLKLQLYQKIPRDLFCKYLIKRYKLFSTDLEEYEYLMDAKYKIMYGCFNLKWAAKHIQELDQIGLSDKLYRLLKNSEFKNCLESVKNIPKNSVFVESEIENIKKIKVSCESDICAETFAPYELKSLKKDKIVEDVIKDDMVDSSNGSYSEDDGKIHSEDIEISDNLDNEYLTEPLSSDHKNIHIICQKVYDSFKSDIADVSSLIFQVESSCDYEYLLNTIYNWSSQNRHFIDFQNLFIMYSSHFSISYSVCRMALLSTYKKFRSPDLIVAIAKSIKVTDIFDLIEDFKEMKLISDGYNILVQKYSRDNKMHEIINRMVFSDEVSQVYIGSRAYKLLISPTFDLNHLVKYKLDDIVCEAVRQLEDKKHNDLLIPVLFSRGLTDELSALICQKIDISQLNEKNLQRLYSLFYLNPLNYVKYEIYKHGFSLDDHIVLDLIKALENVYSPDLFDQIVKILKSYEFKQEAYDQIVSMLDTSNHSFKSWALQNISTENINLPFFVKFCLFVSNEDDLDLVRSAIKVLKEGKSYDIIDKWAQSKKFERLTRRIYPLRMTDKNFYMNLLNRCNDIDEIDMLKQAYNL